MYICVYDACMEHKAYCILIQTKTKQLQLLISHFIFTYTVACTYFVLQFISVATSS